MSVLAKLHTLLPPSDSMCATIGSDPKPVEPKRISLDILLRLVLLAAGMWVCVAGLRAAASVLAPVVAALFIALVLASPFPSLARFMPRPVAALMIALLWAGALLSVVLLAPLGDGSLALPVERLSAQVIELLSQARVWASEHGIALPEALDGQWVFDAGSLAVQLTVGLLATLMFAGFTLGEMWGLEPKLHAALGGQPQRLALVADVVARIRTYFRLKSITSAATGFIVGCGCAAVGVDFPFMWGLLAFALNYVPTIGSFIAAVPPVLLAAATLGWEHALVLGLVYLVTNGLIGGYIEPKIMGDRMGLSPLVVMLSLAFWGWVWGPMGMLLAVPMTVVLKIVMDQIDELRPFAVLLGSGKEGREVLASQSLTISAAQCFDRRAASRPRPRARPTSELAPVAAPVAASVSSVIVSEVMLPS